MFKTACVYISGQENPCPEDAVNTIYVDPTASSQTNSFPLTISAIIIGLAIAAVFIYLLARYAYKVATRTGRSRVGFVWMSIILPVTTWVICLVLDKNEHRYSDEEREKHKLKVVH
jgi:amino acid transporter